MRLCIIKNNMKYFKLDYHKTYLNSHFITKIMEGK